jgi:microcystin-dependent protein
MSKKLNELTEKTAQLDQNDLMLVSSNNVSKSVKVSTLEAPLKQYATDKADEALSTAQSEIEAEESRALAAESSLQSQISAEISSRQLAVSVEATSRSSSISAEQSRAETVEGSLQSQIDAEISRAQAAESSLQSSLTTTSNLATATYNSLNSEITRAQAAENLLSIESKTPVGTIITSVTNVAPYGYLECNGKPVSRTTYADLFAIMETSHGSGDGSTTFNLPDLQGMFLRGAYYSNYLNISGVSSNNFSLFGENTSIWRTGTKLRLSQGTITGISAGVDYYYIYINNSTFAVASTFANALIGTKVAVSSPSANASFIQYEDPGVTSRTNYTLGSSITTSAGSMQTDAFQGHRHNVTMGTSSSSTGSVTGSGVGSLGGTQVKDPITDGTNGTPRTSTETRPKNISVFYHIKY